MAKMAIFMLILGCEVEYGAGQLASCELVGQKVLDKVVKSDLTLSIYARL
jgi:hypothetical protein